jgi:hypothetical protein
VQVFGKPRGPIFTFRIQNDAQASIRYVLGRQVYTLKPGHTRIHPDSENFPTYFESLDGPAHAIPMQRRTDPAAWYRIVSDRKGGTSVIMSP